MGFGASANHLETLMSASGYFSQLANTLSTNGKKCSYNPPPFLSSFAGCQTTIISVWCLWRLRRRFSAWIAASCVRWHFWHHAARLKNEAFSGRWS